MLRALKTKWGIWKARSRQKKLLEEAARVAKTANRDDRERVRDDWWMVNGWEVDNCDWKVRDLQSRITIEEAEDLYLPVPSHSDAAKWDSGTFQYAPPVLTPEAMGELRSAIRAEKKARRETADWWIRLFVSLTGLVGALIGLFSIILK